MAKRITLALLVAVLLTQTARQSLTDFDTMRIAYKLAVIEYADSLKPKRELALSVDPDMPPPANIGDLPLLTYSEQDVDVVAQILGGV